MKKIIISSILVISICLSNTVDIFADFAKIDENQYASMGQEFTPLDLTGVANRDFADEVADDGKGGWTDQGAINDMRYFDLKGLHTLCGVDFNFIDPKTNNGNACVVLRGQNKMELPTSVEVPVGKKGAGAYFLHSSAWVSTICGRYVFVYEDGTEASIDVRGKKDVFNWWGTGAGDRAITAWSGANDSTGTVSLYMFVVENPNPDKIIEKIRMETDGDTALLMIAAVTLTDRGPYLLNPEDKGNRDTSNWFPYDLPTIDDIQDTVLDMSFVLDAPAGKHGYITIAENGDMFFEDGTEAKFWGVNLGPEQLSLSYNRIDVLVDRLAAHGFNLVRFHQLDNNQPSNIFSTTSTAKKLDPFKMDRICYFMAKMKEKGMYLYLDQGVLMPQSEDDNHMGSPGMGLKDCLWYEERAMEMYENYMKQLLGWYNPYTGYKIAEDPMLVFVTYANETSILNLNSSDVEEIYQKEADKQFCKWLKEKYKTEENLRKAWKYEGVEGLREGESLADNTIEYLWQDEATGATKPRHDDIIQFGSNAISAFYDRMTELVRGLGCKALLSPATYWGMRKVGMGAAIADSQVSDSHNYWSHPSSNKSMRTGTKSTYNKPISMLEDSKVGIFSDIMMDTIYGMPHTISEWEECEMNPRLAEGGVMMAAYASLHDWDPIFFAYGMRDDSDTTTHIATSMQGRTDFNDKQGTSTNRLKDFFRMYNQPIKMATMPVAAVMFLRGDIKESDKEFYIRYSNNDYFNSAKREHSSNISLGLIGKVGTTYDKKKYSEDVNDNDLMYLAYQARDTDKRYVSISGEILTDLINKVFQLNTERSQAASGFIGGKTLETDDMLLQIENEFATVTLMSLSDDAIWDADKILLTVAGDARNKGEIRSADGMEIIRGGGSPILIEPITGKVTIKTRDDIAVYKIATEGTRCGTAKTEKDKNGYTVIYLSEDDCVLNYEIVRTRKYDGVREPNKKIVFKDNEIKPLFEDLGGYEWAEKQITRNALQKIMPGISSTEFAPGEYVTKAELIAYADKALVFRGGSNWEGNFSDVSKETFGYENIGKAKELGIVNGDENGLFNPDSPVTRQDMMVILSRVAENTNETLKSPANEFENYSDTNEVSGYALDSVKTMLAQDYVKELLGNKIEPKKYVTRAELSYILYGMLWY